MKSREALEWALGLERAVEVDLWPYTDGRHAVCYLVPPAPVRISDRYKSDEQEVLDLTLRTFVFPEDRRLLVYEGRSARGTLYRAYGRPL